MGEVKITLDTAAVKRAVVTSDKMNTLLRRKCELLVEYAKTDFLRQQRGDNEWRTSETTPPKYIGSFYVEKIVDGTWHAGNNDPGWNLVEYGAHAGGNPKNFVLRYRPLAHGFDQLIEFSD